MNRRSAALLNLWSRQEIRRLRELAEAGVPLDAIATTLGRTRSAIRNKAGMHAISLRSASGGHDPLGPIARQWRDELATPPEQSSVQTPSCR